MAAEEVLHEHNVKHKLVIPDGTPVVTVYSDAGGNCSGRGNHITVGKVPDGEYKGMLFYIEWLDGGSGPGWIQSGPVPPQLLTPGLESEKEVAVRDLLLHIPAFSDPKNPYSSRPNDIPMDRIVILEGDHVHFRMECREDAFESDGSDGEKRRSIFKRR